MSEFLQYDDARKNRILEAALVEFANKGYRKASTNTIVREAKVSKGLLFHYFISKKELYIRLYKYALETITNELYEGVNFADRDVLNRLSASTIQKIESYRKHPLFVKLFENNLSVEDEEIVSRTNKFSEEISKESYAKIFSNIDYFFFSDRININHALEVVKWTIDRISNNWLVQNEYKLVDVSYDTLVEEIDIYLDLFRSAFYK
jgi:AcrR family transcriptional regulator